MMLIRVSISLNVAVAALLLLTMAAPTPASPPQTHARREAAPKVDSPAEVRAGVARFGSHLHTILGQSEAEKGYWGLLVADAATGETLYALNAEHYFSPGSNAKLFTTVLALATLGPDYRFRTTIETSGRLDNSGRLLGDLVLVGRGDPSLSNRKYPYEGKVEREGPADKALAEMAAALVAKGLREIDGDVIADDSYFPYDPYPAGWEVGDLFFEFGAPVSAIAVNDNSLAVEVKPGDRIGDAARLSIEPWAGYETFAHEIATGAVGSKLDLAVVRVPGPHSVLLRGSVPLGAAPAKLDLAMDDPAEYAAHLLKRLLEARGVRIHGEPRARHVPPAAMGIPVVLAEHVSPPLIELVRLVNKISQNLHAELLLRAVARVKTGVGSTESGLNVEKDFLTRIGVAEGSVALADGSGLVRNNLVTPTAVVQLLRFAAQQPWSQVFISTLPVAGEDGTLTERMKGTAAAGRVRAKTGALEHMRALSGFAATLGGTRLVFSIFANNSALHGKDASNVLDEIAVAMVEEIGEAPAKGGVR